MATVAKNTRSTTINLAAPSAGPFSLGFRLFDDDDVHIYIDGVEVTNWTLSSVYADGFDDNASIAFASTVSAPSTIIIDSALVPSRAADLTNGDASFVQRLNIELGRVWSVLAELRRDSDRSVRGFLPIVPVDGVDFSVISGAETFAIAASNAADAAADAAAAAAAAQNTILKPKGQWLTATAYVIGDLVYQTGSQYECITAHTSGVFATDLSASRWRIFVAQGASGAGTGDVIAANSGSEFVPAASAFRGNLAIPASPTTKFSEDVLTKAWAIGGFWNVGAGCTNMPSGGADGDHVLVKRFDDNNLCIIWVHANGDISVNKRNAGTWTGWIRQATQAWVATAISDAQKILHVREEQPSGTHGGTATAGSYLTRVLNTVLTNTISGASLASNQITLPAGTYEIDASVPGFICGGFKAKLYNVTDGADLIIGNFGSASVPYQTGDFCTVRGRFTLAATKALDLRMRCNVTRATDGLGVALGYGDVEVYADVFIKKIS